MALNKDFKVKDTITVGQSGWFGNTVQIGTHNDYISVDPALTVWGPILSGGIDLAEFIGDGVDGIYEGDSVQGTIKYQTQADAQFNPSEFTHVEVLGLQTYDSPTFNNLTLSGDNLTVEGASFSLSGNSTTTVLSGANEIIIDPAGYGTGGNLEAGKVRIAGDLIVDGDTFTVNSTSVSLSDTVIQLGNSEDGGIAADTSVPTEGLGIQAGTMTGASILYRGSAGWEINGNELTSLVDFKVGAANGDFFQVDASNGNVTTQGTLTVNSTTTLSGDLYVKTDANAQKFYVEQATGNTDIEGTLNVAGLATFETTGDSLAIESLGTVSVSGDLQVNDSGAGDTNYFLVDNSSGLTTIADLTVSDLTENQIVLPDANKNLEGSADFTFDGTTFDIGQGKFTATKAGVVYADSNVSINGTTTLSGDLVVKTDGTDLQKFKVTQTSGNVETEGTLTVEGATTINNTLDVDGATTLNTVDVSGVAVFDDSITQNSGTGATASTVKTDVIRGTITDSATNWIEICDATAESFKAIVVAADGGTDKSVFEVLGMPLLNGTDVNGTVYGQVDSNASDPYVISQDLSANVDGKIYLNVVRRSGGTDGTVTVHIDSMDV